MHYNNETQKAAWMRFVEKYSILENDNTAFCDTLDKFLKEYEPQEWIAHKNFSSGIACEMVYYTEIFVDKDV